MKQPRILLSVFLSVVFFLNACTTAEKRSAQTTVQTDSVAANIKMYTHVWDEIINNGRLELLNDSSFTKDVVMHGAPDVVGIDSSRAMYANYVNGFSNRVFTIIDAFGQGNKLVKHWNFKGKHTGVFFGIPPTGKDINITGVTLVRMQGGKIAEEQDFLDNLDFMTQLGLMPAPGK